MYAQLVDDLKLLAFCEVRLNNISKIKDLFILSLDHTHQHWQVGDFKLFDFKQIFRH